MDRIDEHIQNHHKREQALHSASERRFERLRDMKDFLLQDDELIKGVGIDIYMHELHINCASWDLLKALKHALFEHKVLSFVCSSVEGYNEQMCTISYKDTNGFGIRLKTHIKWEDLPATLVPSPECEIQEEVIRIKKLVCPKGEQK